VPLPPRGGMASPDDESPVESREGSPLPVDGKRAMIRELDRAVRHGAPGLRTSTWTAPAGCVIAFEIREGDRIWIRLRYDERRLPGPVTVPSVEGEPSAPVSQGRPPTAFVRLSPAHAALYEDLTDAAGRAVEPYAVTVPDSPVARTAEDGVVTFDTDLDVLTGDGDADRETFEWG